MTLCTVLHYPCAALIPLTYNPFVLPTILVMPRQDKMWLKSFLNVLGTTHLRPNQCEWRWQCIPASENGVKPAVLLLLSTEPLLSKPHGSNFTFSHSGDAIKGKWLIASVCTLMNPLGAWQHTCCQQLARQNGHSKPSNPTVALDSSRAGKLHDAVCIADQGTAYWWYPTVSKPAQMTQRQEAPTEHQDEVLAENPHQSDARSWGMSIIHSGRIS